MNAKKLEDLYGFFQRVVPVGVPSGCLVNGAAIAVVLLGLALFLPGYVSSNSRGQHQACLSNLKNIGTALEMYSTDWSGKYPKNLGQLTPNYLKTIPACPAAGKDTYSQSLELGLKAPFNEDGYEEYYYIDCHGWNHKANGYPENRPAYDGATGLRLR